MDKDIAASAPGQQVTVGLVKLSLVLRHQAWQSSGKRGLTPTQSQVLALVATLGTGVTVSLVAEHLSVTKGSASVAISALEKKGLLEKRPDPNDGRVVHLKLTRGGRAEAKRSTQWPEVLVQAIDSLPDTEQGGFLRGLIGVIRNLQAQGQIPTSRMCAECRFFRPNQYPGTEKLHHCDFIDEPIADVDLRIDCAEMEPADPAVRPKLMEALFSGAQLTPTQAPDREER
ncbi:MAG: MarR family winged helix-turn-helix transcriptional regulator [Planctomycetota bacterium]|nr:MarR family winged helix-turn-helix transcriptional regulator [Planctomycetota bacterium]